MPFREESKFERKPEEIKEEIEPLATEIKEKYPESYSIIKGEIDSLKSYTSEVKEKYPELKELNQYAREVVFREVLISGKKTEISIALPFNYLIFPEKYFPRFRELKGFAPDFLDKGIKHIFGAEKERIAEHEKEHFRGFALKTAKTKYERLEEIIKKRKSPGGIFEITGRNYEEVKKLKLREEKEADTQRILRYSENVKDVIDAIAILSVCNELFLYGVEEGLGIKKKLKEKMREHQSEYPYLKQEIIKKAIEKEEELKDELKEKYEKWKERGEKQ